MTDELNKIAAPSTAKGNTILSFIGRYWILAVLFGISIAPTIPQIDLPFRELGAIIYAPSLVLGALLCALIMRHSFFPNTLDNDSHSGYFTTEWQKLEPLERIKWNLIICSVLFVGSCMIFAALAK